MILITCRICGISKKKIPGKYFNDLEQTFTCYKCITKDIEKLSIKYLPLDLTIIKPVTIINHSFKYYGKHNILKVNKGYIYENFFIIKNINSCIKHDNVVEFVTEIPVNDLLSCELKYNTTSSEGYVCKMVEDWSYVVRVNTKLEINIIKKYGIESIQIKEYEED